MSKPMTVSLDQMIAFMTDCVAGAPDPDQRDMNAALLSRLQQLREAQGALEAGADVLDDIALKDEMTPCRTVGGSNLRQLSAMATRNKAAQLRALVETEGE